MFLGIPLYQLQISLDLQKIEQEVEQKMRANLSPEAFKEWKHEQEVERRHKELCRSIEKAGKDARPSGIGIFW